MLRLLYNIPSDHDSDHTVQLSEHKKPDMMEDRQLEGNLNTDEVFAAKLCEFKNSAVVELVRGTETQVVLEFMMAHKRHEQKVVITNKGIAETSVQKRKL